MAKDPLASLNEPSSELLSIKKERDSLLEHVRKQGDELEALRKINATKESGKAGRHYTPNMEAMIRIWELAYSSALQSIFARGLGYWNMKASTLQQELTLAVVRADEALEGYIQARRTLADPAIVEQQRFDRERNTNSLAK